MLLCIWLAGIYTMVLKPRVSSKLSVYSIKCSLMVSLNGLETVLQNCHQTHILHLINSTIPFREKMTNFAKKLLWKTET
jgi:hypothetical protein